MRSKRCAARYGLRAQRIGEASHPGPPGGPRRRVAYNSVYITRNLIERHGASDGCDACAGLSTVHSGYCRTRFENLYIAEAGPGATSVELDDAGGNPVAAGDAADINSESLLAATPTADTLPPGSDSMPCARTQPISSGPPAERYCLHL